MNTVVLSVEDYNGNYQKNGVNDYDYIEIGTCDWDVMSMTKPALKGIIVEPISLYLNNIPPNKNVTKVNKAISTTNGNDYMYYIPPETIEKENIVNCFRGMNRLGTYHQGAISNKLTEMVKKERCEVITYFELLKQQNVAYVDLLKIDTEGHDCSIINHILDNLYLHPEYVLPRYILFENNGLTPLQTRTDTIYRLHTVGYVHIYTEHDNTFLYNCTSYYLNLLKKNKISLSRDVKLKNQDVHFFKDVHSYLTYGQVDLFKNILKLKTAATPSEASVIWSTHSEEDYAGYMKEGRDHIVNIVHGGGFTSSRLLEKPKLNIIVKSFTDYSFLKNTEHNTGFFIGKYKSQGKLMIDIFNHRRANNKTLSNKFLMLNGFFNFNPPAVKDTYNSIKNDYNVDLYGYDAELGWADIFNNTDLASNVLTKYKFMLHLKGNGYLCNSVVCACMTGTPIIMSRDVYHRTLYSQFIPEELVILIDNKDIARITPKEVIPALEKALKLSEEEYLSLSKKLFIHGTYFREYYAFEIEHLYHVMNNMF